MMGTEKAAAGDGAREMRRGREERREERDKGKEGAASARPRYILENSCYSLSGVLEEQPEQSVLFCGPHDSALSSGLQDTRARLRLKHRLGISFNQPP